MVTAGQWQAVKDTLSRPNGRSLTTSDTLGNSTTNTTYNNLLLLQQPTTPPISYRYNNPSRPYYVIIPLLIQQASLWSYVTRYKFNTLLYCTGHSNLNDVILSIQQPTTPLYRTDTTTYMLRQLIESPTYMLWHRYSNLAYSYTSIDSASFPMILWYSW